MKNDRLNSFAILSVEPPYQTKIRSEKQAEPKGKCGAIHSGTAVGLEVRYNVEILPQSAAKGYGLSS
jgi:hypothetical protein